MRKDNKNNTERIMKPNTKSDTNQCKILQSQDDNEDKEEEIENPLEVNKTL